MRSEAALTCLSEQLSYVSLDQMESNWKPSVGALCVGGYTDGSLYRARVLVVDADTVSVFFIQYKLIYHSKPESTVPSQYAIDCKLDGIAIVTEDVWIDEAQRMFVTSVMDKTLLAQFVSADEIFDGHTPVPCYVVNLLEMGMHVRQRLLDKTDNLTEDSEEAEYDDSDDNANTDFTQVAAYKFK